MTRTLRGCYDVPSERTESILLKQDVASEEEPLDPRVERARRLRPAWTNEQQAALARALRHAPNDGAAAVAVAQVMLGVARRC